MENTPVITVTFTDMAPNVDEDVAKRYEKWVTEVYLPVAMKIAGITGADRYRKIKKSRDYPLLGTLRHYQDMEGYKNFLKNPEWSAVYEDYNLWSKRGVREGVWSAVYELVYCFRAGASSREGIKDTKIENAPLMHLEAYRMSPEDADKFNKWFDVYSQVFIPLFIKSCGLKGYDYFKHSGFAPVAQSRETEYPTYLSVLYFENIEAFEHFDESPEQVSFQSALRTIFPMGLNYKWYVQYELIQSWRK